MVARKEIEDTTFVEGRKENHARGAQHALFLPASRL